MGGASRVKAFDLDHVLRPSELLFVFTRFLFSVPVSPVTISHSLTFQTAEGPVTRSRAALPSLNSASVPVPSMPNSPYESMMVSCVCVCVESP